jgi:hypothetical protein|tara:strand:+ start:542 stop:877 length:336 start_codon:yes stop_codon:yes gene_type:complete
MGLLEKADHDYEMYRDDGYMWGVAHTREINLPKYKQNLSVRKEYNGAYGWRIIVTSYGTEVASGLENVGSLVVSSYHSPTTSRHISYVAEQLGMTVKNCYDETAKKINRYK